MPQKKQNRGTGTAPASRDPNALRSQQPFTAAGWRWQLIASRYRLPSSMARQVDLHCYGEARND